MTQHCAAICVDSADVSRMVVGKMESRDVNLKA